MVDQPSDEQDIRVAQAAANRPPEAGDICVVTAEGAAIDVPALASASDPDGDALQMRSVSMPPSGRVDVEPDGTLTFIPDQPGVQRFTYQVADGRGGTDTAQVMAFVNPTAGELPQPVLQGVDDQELARIAVACAGGQALAVETLQGQSITVPLPAPGERVQAIAQPGQQITLQGGAFAGATYLVAEGGLLVLTDDGRMVYVAGLVDAANSEQPPTLRVAGGEAVPADQLLANLQPIAEPTDGEVVARLVSPQAGPQHWGGANFNPYDPGSIAAGPFPTGPLLPTELGLGAPPVLEGAQALIGDNGDQGAELTPPPTEENEPPSFSATASIERDPGQITITPQFASAGPFPTLVEAVRLPDDQINGVDQRNLTIGQTGDAAIVFRSELAGLVNTLGVYLIDPRGEMVDPRIVFPAIEQSEPDPNFPDVRPGGGPVATGDQVLLSDLYGPDQLHPGQQFGLFLIADGFKLNPRDLAGELHFASDGHTLMTADGRTIAGDIFFTLDPTPNSPNDNPLNPDGLGHVVSGVLPGQSVLTIGFEDELASGGDNDFNDLLVDVQPSPTVTAFTSGAVRVTFDAAIIDPDDSNLSRASVELAGQPSDALAFDGSLAGTGVDLVTSTATSLVFEGVAPIQVYQQILGSVVLDAAPVEGVRQIGLTVFDEQGGASSPFVLSADLSGASTALGTAADDRMIGQPLVDDQMSGLAGNDVLFGDSGNDLLDGGPGNDILKGGIGNDQLIGGPGADTMVFSSLAEGGDRIFGFNANEGDRLDFSQLFDGAADPSDVDPFVRLDAVGDDVQVSVDQDGGGGDFAFVSFATLIDPSGVTTAQEAANNGALVV